MSISAVNGDNVTANTTTTQWHDGLRILGYLESVAVDGSAQEGPVRMLVLAANRLGGVCADDADRVVGGGIHAAAESFVLGIGSANVVNLIASGDAVGHAVAERRDISGSPRRGHARNWGISPVATCRMNDKSAARPP